MKQVRYKKSLFGFFTLGSWSELLILGLALKNPVIDLLFFTRTFSCSEMDQNAYLNFVLRLSEKKIKPCRINYLQGRVTR